MAPNPTTCIYGCSGIMCAVCRQKSSSNLLPNPGFDGSVSPWSNLFSNYSSNDYESCSGSGSYALDYLQDFTQCLNATVGTKYYLTYRFKSWDTSNQFGYCAVSFYSRSGCDGSYLLDGTFSAMASSAGPWVTAVTASGTAPANTVSMSFGCSGSVGRGFYDQLYLGTSDVAF